MKKKRFYASAYVAISALLLSCLGAISVGFASWIIAQGDNSTANGNIQADSIDTKIKGVTVTTTTVIDYGHYFFKVGSAYNGNDEATIEYNIHYDGSQIVDSQTTNYQLNLLGSFSFGDGTKELFVKDIYITNFTYAGNYDVYNASTTSFPNNKAIVFRISEAITNNAYNETKTLSITISNKMIAKYGDYMNGGKFYLRLEVL